MNKNFFKFIIIFLLFSACTSKDYLAPVIDKSDSSQNRNKEKRIITVYEGDSLYSISKREGVPISSIIRANKLEPPFTLFKGDKLIIAEANIYKVKKGNTLFDIAQCYNVSVSDIMKINQLKSDDKIYEGDKIFIPFNENNINTSCKKPNKIIAKKSSKKNKYSCW